MKQTHFNATEGIVLLLKQQIELIESAGKKNGEKEKKGQVQCTDRKGELGSEYSQTWKLQILECKVSS